MAVGKATCPSVDCTPVFALFCIWMSSQMLICLSVLVAVLGGLVYRLSSELVCLRDYMGENERKWGCWYMSVLGIN